MAKAQQEWKTAHYWISGLADVNPLTLLFFIECLKGVAHNLVAAVIIHCYRITFLGRKHGFNFHKNLLYLTVHVLWHHAYCLHLFF